MGTRRALERAPAPGRHTATNGSEGPAEEEAAGPVVRPDSRNYLLNVRPENRTTFCAIISQLTEETQPSFEATLKSRAVSENCDAKFTCIVSGFPEPELTWYKDDEEMDRYCGLPKYEILRNGKRHTLQLYKCREEDAAIYQASARNSKGIVSCSGVLEVGTMTEYKIHQRWFAKLKRKAEAKMREIEQSRKRGKENVLDKLRTLSPERIQRKRRFSAEDGKKSPSSVDSEDVIKVHIPDSTSRLDAGGDSVKQQLINGESEFPSEVLSRQSGDEMTTNGYTSSENIVDDGKEFLAYVCETVETITKRPATKESTAKKKKKEDESVGIPLDLKREEKASASTMQKNQAPSPVPVKSRFSAAPPKNQAHEKMEVEKAAAIQLNRKGVTVSPKIAKMVFAKDAKKTKDVVSHKNKEPEICNTQMCSSAQKGEGYFSLRDMYLENTILPSEEKKTPPIPERVRSKTKTDPQCLKIPKEKPTESSQHLPSQSGQECPNVTPRQDQSNREAHFTHELQATGARLMQSDVKSPYVDSKNMDLKHQSLVTDPIPEIQSSLCVEKGPVSQTISLPTTPSVNKPEKGFAESIQLESELQDVEPSSQSLSVKQTTTTSEKVDVKFSPETHEEPLVLEAPSLEVVAREDALQKYQRLEMEYQALQRAYALLQQQFERTLKSDGDLEDVNQNIRSIRAEACTLEKGTNNGERKLSIQEPVNPQTSPSEFHISTPEMLESEVLASVQKTSAPESSEPKPPARKLKGHTPESKVLTPALNSATPELRMIQTVQPNTVPEQTEPTPPARKTKALLTEQKAFEPVLKATIAEPSQPKTPLLIQTSTVTKPSVTRVVSETSDPLTLAKTSEQEKRDAESELKSSAPQPRRPGADIKNSTPMPSEDTKSNVKQANAADVHVFMETEPAEKENSTYTSKTDSFTISDVDCSAHEPILHASTMPLDQAFDPPLACMEYNSDDSGHLQTNHNVEIGMRHKFSEAHLLIKAEAIGEVSNKKKDTLRSLLKEGIPGQRTEMVSETAVFPVEVEMIEDTKHNQQTSGALTERCMNWMEEHQPCSKVDLPSSEIKSLPAVHENIANVLSVVEDSSEIESVIVLECTDDRTHSLPSNTVVSVSSQSDHQEVCSNVLTANVPTSSSSSDESVASLLRDAKKELDTKITSDNVSPTEIDNPPKEKLSTKGCLEVEMRLQMSQGEVNDRKKHVLPGISQAIEENDPKIEMLAGDSLEAKEPKRSEVTIPLVSQHTQEVVLDNISMDQEKENSGFVASLKNSLLMLLNITKTEIENKGGTKDKVKVDQEDKDNRTHKSVVQHVDTVSLNPITMILSDSAKSDNCSPKEESLTSSSTSGIMTPSSDDDMVQNVEVLQQSPTTYRKFAEEIDKVLFPNTDIPCIPRNTLKQDGMTSTVIISSKEDLSTLQVQNGKMASETEGTSLSVPSIVVADVPFMESTQANDISPDLPLDTNETAKSEENVSLIPSATPQELALGARRKIFLSKSKQSDDVESALHDSIVVPGSTKKESPTVSPGLSRRNQTLLQTSTSSHSPPVERRSPGVPRKMTTLEVPKIYEESTEEKTSESTLLEGKDCFAEMKDDIQEPKKANDPYKAPQVIRKIRVEQFSDSSGNLKLWCQFFNILSDSTISWFKDEYPVAEATRCSGDEGQVALAIVQASKNDCGVYQCTIQNKYGTDSTDFLLSAEVLSGFITREETEVGEEIEMTPMVFAKGLADSGYWGDKFFGRILAEDVNVGKGFLRKILRVKVIYGLEPMFEAGKTCIIKIRNLITFGTKNESTLLEKNYDLTIQACKIQNTTREYCKIFAAEARVVSNFGQIPEIIPLNLIYRPANNIPYATIEDDLEGRFEKYCTKDKSGSLQMKNATEIEKKCCAFQHWVYQWTNGNFLITDLQGVGWKITNVAIATKNKGYQGLKESCCPASIDLFTSVHLCNSYCEMLGLRKCTDTLQTPAKPKGSKSPSMGRKSGSTQSSPQIPKKSMSSPQGTRKSAISPKTSRKSAETGEVQPSVKHKAVETSKLVRLR
ncbi:alpha-protein kinase 3 isoform X2 [Ambystoma mexicanum]|uniref:alpha-protein kinase 3 isoform X2 n=1 Tax=Ambystoma mexicanum TaxID=8296 RepID=UPI0037E8E92F